MEGSMRGISRFLVEAGWVFSLFASPVLAHGGRYLGPSDTVPPGGTAPGPTSAGPVGPGGVGPTSPGPGGPGAAPKGPGPSNGGPGSVGAGGVRSGGTVGPDLSLWVYWWELNSGPFLNLKRAVFSEGPMTGDDLWLGRRSGRGEPLKPTPELIQGLAVPALKKALEEETQSDIVTGCLIALGKMGGEPGLVDLFRGFLPSRHQDISETAALAMGILADPKGLEILSHLVKDDEEGRKDTGRSEVPFRTRAFAVYGMGLIGGGSRDELLRAEVVRRIREVLRTDRSAYKDVKVACILSLALVPDPDRSALEDLRRILRDPDQDEILRAHCPLSLAKLLTRDHPLREEVVKDLLGLLGGRRERMTFVRQSTVYALGLLLRQGQELDGEGIKALQRNLGDARDEQERNFTMIALGKIGGPEAQKFLLEQIEKGRQPMRPWAALGLGILGRSALEAGARLDSAIPAGVMEAFSKEGNRSHLAAYAIALGMLQHLSSAGLLLDVMRSAKDDELKGYCCVALGMMQARETKAEMQRVVKESVRRPELLQQAVIGLGLLGDKTLVPDLLEILREAKTLAVQSAAASALGFIGDSRSIGPLVEALLDKKAQPLGRGLCAVALGIICDREELAWNTKLKVDFNYRASVTSLTDKAGGTGICDIL